MTQTIATANAPSGTINGLSKFTIWCFLLFLPALDRGVA
jgi:hypothetical protein